MPLTGKDPKSVIRQTLHEYRTGGLHSGKGGKKVKSRKQAIAIALSEARRKFGRTR